jgi:hypothetical protein
MFLRRRMSVLGTLLLLPILNYSPVGISQTACLVSAKKLLMKRTFESHQILRTKDTYLWDNWSFYNSKNKTYYRYSLSAPENVGDADARHAHARIRVFTSKNAQQWKDEGLIWSDDLTWSGQSYWDASQERVLLFHTRGRDVPNDMIQKISVAESYDGIRFSAARTLLDPEDPLTRAQALAQGYNLDTGKALVMAWRDPYFFENQLFFASKAKDPRSGKILPVVARARSAANIEKFSLEKPIFLPIEESITQIELPNIARLKNGRYVMSVNLSDRVANSTASADVNTWVRFYTADSIDGPWRVAKGPSLDSQGNLFDATDRIYGFNLMGNSPDGSIQGSGFFRRGGQEPHSLTPLVTVEIVD